MTLIVEHSHHDKTILIFLATAGVVAPLFRRLKLSPILGFLAAGFCLGPFGLGLLAHQVSIPWLSAALSALALDNVAEIAPVAEFGVVFLLFMIGLELSWERLMRLRGLVFGFGALQVFGCAAVIGTGAFVLGEPASAALILGFALALSSTAIVIPVLADRRRLGTTAGRTIFSVLLFQDLMVAPLLFLVAALGTLHGGVGALLLYRILPAIIGIALVVLVGRLVLRPLFHLVAAAGSPEFFMAACLLVVIGTGFASATAGLSMGLGAFIAGLLLAETEYRRQIEVTIDPFRGLLLGLFFVSIGADLDLELLYSAPLLTLGLAAAIVLIKFVVTYAAGRLFRLNNPVALESALMLGPGGEFAFVMIVTAIAGKVMPADFGADAMVAVTLSMFAIPLIGALATRLPRAAPDPEVARAPEEDAAARKAIIVGFGRVGQLVSEMLKAHQIPFLVVETNAGLVRRFRGQGIEIYWGDAARPEFLARCGIAKARALVATVDAPQASEEIVAAARSLNSDLTIVARARDADHARLLYELGVTDAVPETVEASLQLSEAVLVDLGIPMGHVIASVHAKRDEYRKVLQVRGATERGSGRT
ncbi:MAG TPA: cation:proton antiporter [Methylovirgula sp.]|nr:cation:proton antiporter [Methylovirgula sp.]